MDTFLSFEVALLALAIHCRPLPLLACCGMPLHGMPWHASGLHGMACMMAWHGIPCLTWSGMPFHVMGMALAWDAMRLHAIHCHPSPSLPIAMHCPPLPSISVHCRPLPFIAVHYSPWPSIAAALPSAVSPSAAPCRWHCCTLQSIDDTKQQQ